MPPALTRRDTLGLGTASLASVMIPQAAAADTSITDHDEGDLAIGNANAPMTIALYLSLGHPGCAALPWRTLPWLLDGPVAEGRARLVLHEVHEDPPALWAAAIARSTGDLALRWSLTSLFLTQQAQWRQAAEPALALVALAEAEGLPASQAADALSDTGFLARLSDAGSRRAAMAGLRALPTLWIGDITHIGAPGPTRLAMLFDLEP
jgi:protein-disulfide isomerase